jgi:hypothetical protein
VTEEQAREAWTRYGEALFQEGVKEIRPDRDRNGWFILVVATSESAADALKRELSPDLDGVPLRVAVE